MYRLNSMGLNRCFGFVFRSAGSAIAVAALVGCCRSFDSRFCIEARIHASRLATAADDCCKIPEDQVARREACQACIDNAYNAISNPTTGLGAILQACDDDSADPMMELLRTLGEALSCALGKPVKPTDAGPTKGGGAATNRAAVLTQDERLQFHWSMTVRGQDIVPALLVQGEMVPSAAVGSIVTESALPLTIVESVPADIGILVSKYAIPVGARMTLTRDEQAAEFRVRGEIGLTPLQHLADGSSFASVHKFSLSLTDDAGILLLEAVAGNVRNSVLVDPSDIGTIGVEVTRRFISTTGIDTGEHHDTVWLSVPIQFVSGGSSITIGRSTAILGNELTPASSEALAAARAFGEPEPGNAPCNPPTSCEFVPILGTSDPVLYQSCRAARFRWELRNIAPWCFR